MNLKPRHFLLALRNSPLALVDRADLIPHDELIIEGLELLLQGPGVNESANRFLGRLLNDVVLFLCLGDRGLLLFGPR